MRLVDTDRYRDDFMQLVYDELSSDTTNDRANRIIGAYDYFPTVEAAPVVHGEWARSGGGWMCDRCGYQTADDTANMLWHNYCPSCGAKMDKEEL